MKLSAPLFRLKRQARLLSREEGIPLNKALDRIAAGEGFRSWSQLAAKVARDHRPGAGLFAQLEPGDLVLLGARPGQGKTLLGLELLLEAAKAGRKGTFFTLDYHAEDVAQRLRSMGGEPEAAGRDFALDTSDGICADHIVGRMRGAPRGTLSVIDYLQLLDQRRDRPALAEQLRALKAFTVASGQIAVLISQIDRTFDARGSGLPGLADVRLPNPVDLTLFTKCCFLHEGEISLEEVRAA
ncbi:DNA helicase [Nisaea acidiphila]|uniref:DNA helicase n=1 Tax=Nisaea acidiphila TaxID=1862145 RepID=A0A9J7ANP2_9PROT|nr:DNA helicase [Nisaea acidiphila]UUX48782.1 DNA helicase [Nisaea acidiphila]